MSASREIGIFFPDFDVEDWYKTQVRLQGNFNPHCTT